MHGVGTRNIETPEGHILGDQKKPLKPNLKQLKLYTQNRNNILHGRVRYGKYHSH